MIRRMLRPRPGITRTSVTAWATAACLALAMLPAARCAAADDTADAARRALKRAATRLHSISTNGGYAGIYSLDLSERYGEAFYERAGRGEIWVQPPGTPTVGESYLRAWRATGDEFYLKAATDAARALVWGQRKVGGWGHRVDVSHLREGRDEPVRTEGRCSMDDNVSQGALSFLIDMDREVDEPWLTSGVELGCRYVMESQFESGGWPQWYPLIGGYHDYYTFNDNTINDCIRVMLEAHGRYGNEEYLRTAEAVGEFIIESRLDPPQAGWAQQYSHDLEPAWARRFEPPGVCSAVTARNIRTLVDLYLYTGKEKYLSPIPDAVRWLEESQIGRGRWARLYEVGTNRPVYGDRADGRVKHYDYEELSERERSSYGWQGGFGVRGAVACYERVKSLGREEYRARRNDTMSADERKRRAEGLRPAVRRVIDALDEKGRWVSETEQDGETQKVIYSKVFVRNVRTLCRYLELTGGEKG